MTKLYYTAPTDEVFDEMKSESIKLWKTYDNTYGYVDEKVNMIKDLKNYSDNFMYMFAMFDLQNQNKILSSISDDCFEAVMSRLKDGGMTESEFIRYYPIFKN